MLFRLIRKNLSTRPLRYALTGIAIIFGVASVTAVFIFTDGLRTAFTELAANIESGYDVRVKSDSPFGDNAEAALVPTDVVADLEGVDGVRAVQPGVVEFGVVLIDNEDEAIIANGPNLGVNWESRTPNPSLFVHEGREPQGPGEVAIDRDGFETGNLAIGERYRVQTPVGTDEFTLVGTFNFGDPEENAALGAVLIAFEEQEALRLLNDGQGYDEVLLVGDGVEPAELVTRVQPVLDGLGGNLIAEEQAVVVAETESDFGQILDIFRWVLLGFAIVILLVSAFLIYNVFAITLGQRIKELGSLRALGALGNQVTSMMLGEALLLGIIATVVGIPAGWLLARLLRFGLSQLGFPGDTGLPIEPLTIGLAIGVGVVVTMIASAIPSVRARRVSPMSAIRDDIATMLDTDPKPTVGLVLVLAGVALQALMFFLDGWIPLIALPVPAGLLIYFGIRLLSKQLREFAGFVVLAHGLGLLTYIRFADRGLADSFSLLASSALLTVIGTSLVSSFFAKAACRIIGRGPTAILVGLVGVLFALGAIGSVIGAIVVIAGGNPGGVAITVGTLVLAILAWALLRTAYGGFGLTGYLGRENAARNPKRTSTTATALMVGLSLVTLVTVVGDSIKSSITDAFESSIQSDWLIQGPQAGPTGLPFSNEVKARIEGLPEIDDVINYRFSFQGYAAVEGDVDPDEVAAALPEIFAAIQSDDPGALPAIQDRLGATDVSIDALLAAPFDQLDPHVDPDFVERLDGPIPVNGVYMEDGIAEDRGLALGDTYVAVFLDGAVEELVVAGIYSDAFVLGERVIQLDLWEQHSAINTDFFLQAITADGVSAEDARAAMEAELAVDYPTLTVQDRSEFAAEAENNVNQFLATVNVLLLLSAAIAVLGIAVALSLAVFERTREIGLLRAVGTTRQQTRWIIRWEGVIVAAFGGVLGVLLGVGLGVLVAQLLPEVLVTTTTVPFGQVALYVLIAAITGLGAGAFPAWIAGRINVLDAIGTE